MKLEESIEFLKNIFQAGFDKKERVFPVVDYSYREKFESAKDAEAWATELRKFLPKQLIYVEPSSRVKGKFSVLVHRDDPCRLLNTTLENLLIGQTGLKAKKEDVKTRKAIEFLQATLACNFERKEGFCSITKYLCQRGLPSREEAGEQARQLKNLTRLETDVSPLSGKSGPEFTILVKADEDPLIHVVKTLQKLEIRQRKKLGVAEKKLLPPPVKPKPGIKQLASPDVSYSGSLKKNEGAVAVSSLGMFAECQASLGEQSVASSAQRGEKVLWAVDFDCTLTKSDIHLSNALMDESFRNNFFLLLDRARANDLAALAEIKGKYLREPDALRVFFEEEKRKGADVAVVTFAGEGHPYWNNREIKEFLRLFYGNLFDAVANGSAREKNRSLPRNKQAKIIDRFMREHPTYGNMCCGRRFESQAADALMHGKEGHIGEVVVTLGEFYRYIILVDDDLINVTVHADGGSPAILVEACRDFSLEQALRELVSNNFEQTTPPGYPRVVPKLKNEIRSLIGQASASLEEVGLLSERFKRLFATLARGCEGMPPSRVFIDEMKRMLSLIQSRVCVVAQGIRFTFEEDDIFEQINDLVTGVFDGVIASETAIKKKTGLVGFFSRAERRLLVDDSERLEAALRDWLRPQAGQNGAEPIYENK